MNWTMSFECRTTGAPKRSTKTWKSDTTPETLAEMLAMLRGMGFKPEDVYVGPITIETSNGYSTYH